MPTATATIDDNVEPTTDTDATINGTATGAGTDTDAPTGKAKTADAPILSPVKKSGTYRSGFCGGTVINNVFVTNGESLHRRCSSIGGMCSCTCHSGEAVWEGAEQAFADAKAGRRVTTSRSAQPAGAKRSLRGGGGKKKS